MFEDNLISYEDNYPKENVDFSDIYNEINMMAGYIIMQLRDANASISFAESCTGGLLAGSFIGVSGSSDVINESYVTYANESKVKILNIPLDVINEKGAVSVDVAGYMAKGVAKIAKSEVGVGITGVAGPTGGTDEKPVGLVYIGISINGDIKVCKCNFKGDRLSVRLKAVKKAIDLLAEAIK
ncbi:MAG: CinA family protein [Lachnospiraceae bacterium]|nr:CinA family protein [Lachnospiraceae bacterium]